MAWLTSAYLLLMVLLALSQQGRPTSDVFATNLGHLFYPAWYASPHVITAVKIAVLTYPAAALAYGIATLLSFGKPAAQVAFAPPPDSLQPLTLVTAQASIVPPPARPRTSDPMQGAPLKAAGLSQAAENDANLCVLDLAFFIRSVSRGAASIIGLPSSTLQRRPFTNFVAPADVNQLHQTWDNLLRDPQTAITLRLRIRRPDDAIAVVDATCRAGLGAEGRVISMALAPVADEAEAALNALADSRH